ncbi:DUF2917 domain-containing protein [Paraburkholderia sp. CNPSo 3281]|uniref:DUF2917 domain-containing protein n=1 Tax=Paraburkholderia sp. CNPSo 3281 TaxID=2940933 RepID=UPI0020B6392F|nr:DUF2917 domain-containing protein [Paraburkholderia sp. CNPSo 3281]MCP3715678.1 DUF2917 domain-containing protein [Paraburkholderia sp. CNPSo 3281]
MDDAFQAASLTASQPAPQPALHSVADATERFDDPLPAQSIHFAVPPMRTLTWRVNASAALRVQAAQVWVTRARSPYDHWLQPGETLRLERGERIWLSTEAALPARVSITSAWQPPFAGVRRGMERLAAWLALLTLRRSREA